MSKICDSSSLVAKTCYCSSLVLTISDSSPMLKICDSSSLVLKICDSSLMLKICDRSLVLKICDSSSLVSDDRINFSNLHFVIPASNSITQKDLTLNNMMKVAKRFH